MARNLSYILSTKVLDIAADIRFQEDEPESMGFIYAAGDYLLPEAWFSIRKVL